MFQQIVTLGYSYAAGFFRVVMEPEMLLEMKYGENRLKKEKTKQCQAIEAPFIHYNLADDLLVHCLVI